MAAEQAIEHLGAAGHPGVGHAHYELGEILRLQGDVAAAESSFRSAAAFGHDPLPGFALLRLAEGDHRAAVSLVRRGCAEAGSTPRADLLAGAVEVLVGAGDLDAARDLLPLVQQRLVASESETLQAMGRLARARVRLAEAKAAEALPDLRAAATAWRAHRMPFEEACTRALIAHACSMLGDADGAALERDRVAAILEELGAPPIDPALAGEPGAAVGPLTGREREVLRLVASGRTNREVAEELHISEHTIARHLQNIYTKLDVTSRAAATAWAYEHGVC